MTTILSLCAVAWGQTRPDVPVTSPPLEQIVPMEAIVNGEKTGTWALVERLGTWYAPRDAIDEWRVRLNPGAEPITVRGTQYWPLAAIPGFTIKINYASQSVQIDFAPDAFVATKVSKQLGTRPQPSPVLPSVYLNYELNYDTSQTRGSTSVRSLGALTELGVSTGWGVLTSSHVGRNLAGNSTDDSGWLRLETTFTRNLPDSNRTLRLGDSITRTGLWGRGVYFGGVQWGTNYALTPGFLTQPIPVVSGVSAAASTVELYVNDVLRQTSRVPAGPFAIDNTAALTGSGEARMVVRDILGREVVITQPFFTNINLLARGLSDWSVEAGSLRRDLGLANGHYGPPFASGTWRLGLNDKLTLESRGETTAAMQAGGVGLVAGLPGDLLGKAALAASRTSQAGAGRQWVLGLERQWLHSSTYFQAQGASHGFRSLGLDDKQLPIKLQWAANYSQSVADRGAFSLAVAAISRFDAPKVTTVTANYTWRLPRNGSLTATLGRSAGGGSASATFAGLTLQIPLENNRQVTATVQSNGGGHDAYATASQTEGLTSDWGWRVLGGQQANEAHGEAGLYYLGQHGRLNTDLSVSPGQTALRLGAAGGMVFADGHFFATRRVDQGFAVTEIKDVEGIGVGIGTNVLTRTDRAGVALVPNLGAYQPNQIRLDPKDLPISAEIDSIEQIVVPSWRSGVKVDFPVRSGRGALLKIVLDDGEPAPPGAIVRIEGGKEEFYVARRGESYVTGLQPKNRLTLKWEGQQCAIALDLPPSSKDEIPRIGPVLCKGVKR